MKKFIKNLLSRVSINVTTHVGSYNESYVSLVPYVDLVLANPPVYGGEVKNPKTGGLSVGWLIFQIVIRLW